MKEPGVLGHISLRITLVLILAMAAGGSIACYALMPNARDVLAFGAAVVGGAAIIYTAYYASAALRQNTDRARRQHALEILRHLDHIDRVAIRNFIENELPNSELSADDAYKRIASDDTLRAGVVSLLGALDDCYAAIGHGVADEEVLFESLMYMVPAIHDKLRPYILKTRERTGSDVLYIGLERLASAWRDNVGVFTHRPLRPVSARVQYDK